MCLSLAFEDVFLEALKDVFLEALKDVFLETLTALAPEL